MYIHIVTSSVKKYNFYKSCEVSNVIKPINYFQPVTFMQGNLVTQHLTLLLTFKRYILIKEKFYTSFFIKKNVERCVLGTVECRCLASVKAKYWNLAKIVVSTHVFFFFFYSKLKYLLEIDEHYVFKTLRLTKKM